MEGFGPQACLASFLPLSYTLGPNFVPHPVPDLVEFITLGGKISIHNDAKHRVGHYQFSRGETGG